MMARHSDGKNNYAFAPWVIIVAILAALALVVAGFFLFRGDNSDTPADSVAAESSAETAAVTTAETSVDPSTAASNTQAPASSQEHASSAAPSSTDTPTDEPEGVAPNTLFLLDTSDNLAPYFDAVSEGVAEAASAVGAEGSQVGLWNYSSPISASATVGYRNNVPYGDADNVAYAVRMFGTGGVPQTRSAVVAALANAADQAASTGEDARVVLVTTGTQQDMDDATFADAANEARGDGVSLSVVHIGEGEKDAELERLADSFTVVSDASDIAADTNGIASAAGAK